jgi:hypothetical protein
MTTDVQKEPALPDEQWIARFIAHMVAVGTKCAAPDFDVPEYAKQAAPSYLLDRREYIDPEEAADTDISYWEEG